MWKECPSCSRCFATSDFKGSECLVCHFGTARREWREVRGDTTHQRLVRGLTLAHKSVRVRGSFKKQLAAEMLLSTRGLDQSYCADVQKHWVRDFGHPYSVWNDETLSDMRPGTAPFPDAWLFDREERCVHIYEVEDYNDFREPRRDQYLSLFFNTLDTVPWEMVVYHVGRYGVVNKVVGPCLLGSDPEWPIRRAWEAAE